MGFTYTPPKTEDRALMFDNEIRGQLATLMGGRAAEELTCGHLSTGKPYTHLAIKQSNPSPDCKHRSGLIMI